MVKKLNLLQVEKKLNEKELFVFTPRDFRLVFDVKKQTASKFIHTYTKKCFFIKLRNGLYALKDKQLSAFVLANKIYQPSYISLETALSFYGIIPETVYEITSITTKTSRQFTALNQSFTYRRLKKQAFSGYYLTKGKFLIAEPEKALLDYLYLVALKQKTINERLNLKNIKKKKLEQLAKIFSYSGLNKLIKQIYVKH